MTASQDTPPLEVRSLRRNDWPVIERLFGANGACGGCWCMWPRVPRGGKLWEEGKGEPFRAQFETLVRGGQALGVLAFRGKEPVGWCSFGPRSTFPRLERVREIQTRWGEGTWSIVCFYIPAKQRGSGVASALLKAATERAFELGAEEIESYPVVPKKEQVPAAFAWTGVPALFRKAGYRAMRRPGATRPVYKIRR
ncbi:MAG: GNAT family N-acetyltransferase [Planctomycetota bacterium]